MEPVQNIRTRYGFRGNPFDTSAPSSSDGDTFKAMSEWMRKVLENKRQMRKKIAALPFSEKIKILEKLRDRSLAIASNPLRRRAINQG
jgi:hypothetical protein